jgi:hypothetical protein
MAFHPGCDATQWVHVLLLNLTNARGALLNFRTADRVVASSDLFLAARVVLRRLELFFFDFIFSTVLLFLKFICL